MIVGTTNIDIAELKGVVSNNGDIIAYSNKLVPVWARHIKGITNNQRYYLALTLRNIQSVPYKVRKPYIDELLTGITLTGVANSICTMDDIISMCNKDKLVDALKQGVYDEKKI